MGGPGVLAYGDALKLYMAHEHWLVCPTHVLWRHGREVCTGRECLKCSLAYRRPPQFWRSTGYLESQLRHIDTFIAMSEFSRDKHREFGFTRDMEVINCFLPNQMPESSVDRRPHERPYFLFVGKLDRIKGLDDVIPLFKQHSGADLLIAGEGDHAPILRELAKGMGNVRFLGLVDAGMLERYYVNALALIVPSVCFETFGVVLIEAFRLGTPVIARRIGPFPEIIERGGGGLLFDGPDELLDAMKRIQSEPAFRAMLADLARSGFVKKWTEYAVIPQYLNIVTRAAQARAKMNIAAAMGS